MRPGYLYLWHDQGPLRRFAVAADSQLLEQGLDDDDTSIAKGSQAGIALNKQHDALLLYTEIPLSAAVHQRLAAEPDERRARMHRIRLTQVALTLEADHCPALDSADQGSTTLCSAGAATLAMRKSGGEPLDYFRMTLRDARVIGVDTEHRLENHLHAACCSGLDHRQQQLLRVHMAARQHDVSPIHAIERRMKRLGPGVVEDHAFCARHRLA